MGFLLRSFGPALQPHPMNPLQPVPLPNVGSGLDFPELIAFLHPILGNVEFVVRHLRVPHVFANVLGVGGTHVDGHELDTLG